LQQKELYPNTLYLSIPNMKKIQIFK